MKSDKTFWTLLDIDNAIEITLKEYETLRSEILQNSSEVNQLILLGLAAIFTIASLSLAPLSDFLTVEDTTIQMPLYLEDIANIIGNIDENTENLKDTKIKDGNWKIYNESKKNESKSTELIEIETLFSDLKSKIDNFLQTEKLEISEEKKQDIKAKRGEIEEIIQEIQEIIKENDTKYFLKIERQTNGESIEKAGIIPSIVIFNWLIPGLSLYLIYRSLFAIKKNKMIGIYIYHRVEKRLIKLSKKKQEAQYFLKTIDHKTEKNYLTHIGWENYVRRHPSYLETLDITLIFSLFCVISLLSFIGGSLLFFWDFANLEWKFNLSHPDSWSLLIFLLIIPLVLWVFFSGLSFFRIGYLKNLDKPKKLDRLNKMNFLNYCSMVSRIWFLSGCEWVCLKHFKFCKVHFKKEMNERLKKKTKKLKKQIEKLLKKIPKSSNIHEKLEKLKDKFENIKRDLSEFNDLESLPSKIHYTLEELYFLLPKLYNFVLRNEDRDNSIKEKFNKINEDIDELYGKIIILRRINRWSNPHLKFNNIFENVLEDMWKEDD